jgi:hypothetical protein
MARERALGQLGAFSLWFHPFRPSRWSPGSFLPPVLRLSGPVGNALSMSVNMRVGRDAAGHFLPGAAWKELHPNGSPVKGKRLVKQRRHWKVCPGCGEGFEAFAWQDYHNGRCRDRYRNARLKDHGFYKDPRTRELVSKVRTLTAEQRSRLPIREGAERVRDRDVFDPAKGNWCDPRQPKPHELPPALSVPLTTPLEDALARVMRPGGLHRGMDILSGIDGLTDYAGAEIYNKHLSTKVLLVLLIRGLRWLDRQVRKAERRERMEYARSHAQAARIAKKIGLDRSQLETSLGGEPLYLVTKRKNRVVAQTPPEDAPLDQAR